MYIYIYLSRNSGVVTFLLKPHTVQPRAVKYIQEVDTKPQNRHSIGESMTSFHPLYNPHSENYSTRRNEKPRFLPRLDKLPDHEAQK
jgi:hypothetical protein